MKKKINIGIIGKNFGYQVIYNSFILNKKFNVIGFSSRSNNFNTTNIPKNIKIYNNWKQLIDDKKIDAVVIAIPPFYHKEIIKYAIKKNKHIFCEKPVGISIKEVSDLIKVIKNKKLAHIVNFEFPEIEAFEKFKKMIYKKKIHNVSLNWFIKLKNKSRNYWKNLHSKGGGILFNYICHSIYYLEFLFGKIKLLDSRIIYNKKNQANYIYCILIFKDKLRVELNTKIDFDNNNFKTKHEIEVKNKDESLLLSTSMKNLTKTFDIKLVKKNYSKILFKPKKNKKDFRILPTFENSKKFARWILENKKSSPNFNDAKRVHIIIDKMIKSSKNLKIYSIRD